MTTESFDDTRLGPWRNGVAFEYDNIDDEIIGCWDGMRHYNLTEIDNNDRLHRLYHEELSKIIKGEREG